MRAAPLEEQLPGMSEDELETFPLGIVRVDRLGRVTYYNHAQADFARNTGRQITGLNFFADVAPCTAVQEFQGRFNAFVESSGNRIEPFEFLFRFAWGARRVSITFVKRGEADDSIYIVVNSRIFD
jgi:photoactive yellow protein